MGYDLEKGMSMKRIIIAATLAASIGLSGCAGYYGGYDRGYYTDGYDVYYDNYYGDVRDGYWNNDGWYYYRDARSHDYRRDDGRHFRRDAYNGYRQWKMYDRRDRGHERERGRGQNRHYRDH
ncbi:hypothetical protein AEAC466_02470 [Asticcacaulis sp. AC466]|nr:hypothetical protein AEAC466_02470 [Asticcacaulis sp. AC466]